MHDFQIQGIGPAREIVRWAYEAKPGDVSTVFTLDGRYIVAKLVSVQDKGLMAISEQIRPQLESIVRNDKKATQILAKYKGITSLQVAAQTSGQQVSHVDSASLSATYLPNLGYAPSVLGYAFFSGLQVNAVSPAIKSEDGVYIISPTQRWTKPANPAAAMMMMQQRGQMEMQTKNAVSQQLQDALINKAKVEYNAANM